MFLEKVLFYNEIIGLKNNDTNFIFRKYSILHASFNFAINNITQKRFKQFLLFFNQFSKSITTVTYFYCNKT